MSQNEEISEKTNVPAIIDLRGAHSAKDIVTNIVSNIVEGHVDPLVGYTILKRMAKVSEEALKDEKVRNMAENEFDKYAAEAKGKSILLHGAQICKMATYTYYDFSGCGHEVLDELYAIQKEVKDRISLIEDELKLLVPKDEYKAGTIPGFGIVNNNKDVIYSTLPKLAWDSYGGVGTVMAPKKIQKMGLKYMKV